MTTKLSPQQARIPIARTAAGEECFVSEEWYPYLAQEIFERLGGAVSPTVSDIEALAFNDPGVSEVAQAVLGLKYEIGSRPSRVVAPVEDHIAVISQLQARLDVLETEIQSLKQGTLI
jgi:hypothetical protein